MKKTVLGVAAGAGIPLWAAQKNGYKVLGNIENRAFNRKGFLENFGMEMNKEPEEKVDIVIGHPKCGGFSTMPRGAHKREYDIDNFIEGVMKYNPECFFMDNLEKSLELFPLSFYEAALKNYHIAIITSNHKYFIATKNRIRILVVGFKKEKDLKKFKMLHEVKFPYDFKTPTYEQAVLPVLAHLKKDIPKLDHIHEPCRRLGKTRWRSITNWINKYKIPHKPEEFYKGYLPEHCLSGPAGMRRGKKNEPCGTFTKTGWTWLNPYLGIPLTIYERRKVMGVPDDFKILGATSSKGFQIAKTIPYPYCDYIFKILKEVIK